MGEGLEQAGDLALHIILTKLGAKDTARVACVSKRLRDSALEDSVWSNFCREELQLSSPLDPLSLPSPSFREAYKSWREAYGMYPWPLVLRVKRCWDRLKAWLSSNFPEACVTLRQGATEAQIQEVEKILKAKLPLPTRILYRFYDGQDLGSMGDSHSSVPISPLGLIGGYSFYHHWVNVYLLPLSQVVMETRVITHQLGIRRNFSGRTKYIVVAASSVCSEKYFFLNCKNGQLYVGTKNLPMSCVPKSLINLGHDKGGQEQDAMLLWLEEHCCRLENGIIKVREEGGFRTICQFPEEPPFCSSAVTNGVKVRASSVFVPELTDDKNLFSYSIRMALLPNGCMINGMYFSSCQLQWRRWIIRANDTVVSDVNGEAVIGQYPLLLPGESEFVYESCAALRTFSGSVEGSFTFVPGRLIDPKGSPFEAMVARFPLQVPDYIF